MRTIARSALTTVYTNDIPNLPQEDKRGCWAKMLDDFAEHAERCMILEYGNRYDTQSALYSIKNRIEKDGRKMKARRYEDRIYVTKEDDR